MINGSDLYWYRADVVRVVDGDTIIVNIRLGFGLSYEQDVRLAGIDAYETSLRRGTTPEQKKLGLQGKDFLGELLTGKEVLLQTIKESGKYGRYIAKVFYKQDENTDYVDICKMMVNNGYAVYKDY